MASLDNMVGDDLPIGGGRFLATWLGLLGSHNAIKAVSCAHNVDCATVQNVS